MANNAKTYIGLSTDIKPFIYVNVGDFFYETDTEVLYQYNGTSWVQYITLQDLITGGTYSSVTNKITFTKYNGRHIYVSGITAGGGGSVFTGGTVVGPTIFLSGLTANTISATTYYNLPINTFITGGTFNSATNTLNLVNYTGGTVSISGFTSGSGGTSNFTYYITGSTPSGTINSGDRWFDTSTGYELVYINDGNSSQWIQPNNNGQITINSVTGGTSTSGDYLPLSGGTVSGETKFTAGLTANTISATTYYNLPIDVRVTGGSYSNGTATFTNNTGGTFSVTGFTTGTSITQGITGVTGTNGLSASTTNNVTTIGFSGGTIPNSVNFTNGLTANTISATTYYNLPTDIRVTGGTYTNGTATFTNNTGGTFTVTGFYTGTTDVFVTGGTYTNGTATFTNNTGGTFTVTGFSTTVQGLTGLTANNGLSASTTNNITTIGFSGGTIPNSVNFTNGLTANTISATTYQNLPTDIRTTGGTYSNNTFTFTNNTGGTYSVLFNTVTGLTINGNLTVTGTSSLNGSISSSSLTGTTDRMMQVSSAGTVSATVEIISAYISPSSAAATLLSTSSNWDIYGVYTGTTITGTYLGQKHYDDNYFYEAVLDNVFIRLIRG